MQSYKKVSCTPVLLQPTSFLLFSSSSLSSSHSLVQSLSCKKGEKKFEPTLKSFVRLNSTSAPPSLPHPRRFFLRLFWEGKNAAKVSVQEFLDTGTEVEKKKKTKRKFHQIFRAFQYKLEGKNLSPHVHPSSIALIMFSADGVRCLGQSGSRQMFESSLWWTRIWNEMWSLSSHKYIG